jgi:hypothetical protein
MSSPEKEELYYYLSDLADKWHYEVNKLLYYGETGQLQICVVWDSEWRGRTDLNPKIEVEKIFRHPNTPVRPKPGGLHPIYKEDILRIRHGKGIECIRDINNATVAYYFTDAGKPRQDIEKKFQITDLVVTHEEKLRFEETYNLASNTKANTPRKSTRRTRTNELHDVIWAVYLELEEKHLSKPTSGEVWLELKRNYKTYDKAEVIQEIKKGIIYWIDYKGNEQSLKESSFKGTICNIKKKKNINKNSN